MGCSGCTPLRWVLEMRLGAKSVVVVCEALAPQAVNLLLLRLGVRIGMLATEFLRKSVPLLLLHRLVVGLGVVRVVVRVIILLLLFCRALVRGATHSGSPGRGGDPAALGVVAALANGCAAVAGCLVLCCCAAGAGIYRVRYSQKSQCLRTCTISTHIRDIF